MAAVRERSAAVTRYETWYGGSEIPHDRFATAVREALGAFSVSSLCDIGGGANPILERGAAAGLKEYVVTDISAGELAKAPEGARKIVADVTDGPLTDVGPFDLIVSRTVAEHVRDPRAFHASILAMLRRGGRAMHFFPTLYEPVFIANRLLPQRLSDALLQRIQQDRESDGSHGKFEAYYRWCRGPTHRQLRRLQRTGYEIEEYVGVFGHGYYGVLPPLDRLDDRLATLLQRRPRPALTAYAWVTLYRP
jgi:SAM-dependent methyltransferase